MPHPGCVRRHPRFGGLSRHRGGCGIRHGRHRGWRGRDGRRDALPRRGSGARCHGRPVSRRPDRSDQRAVSCLRRGHQRPDHGRTASQPRRPLRMAARSAGARRDGVRATGRGADRRAAGGQGRLVAPRAGQLHALSPVRTLARGTWPRQQSHRSGIVRDVEGRVGSGAACPGRRRKGSRRGAVRRRWRPSTAATRCRSGRRRRPCRRSRARRCGRRRRRTRSGRPPRRGRWVSRRLRSPRRRARRS